MGVSEASFTRPKYLMSDWGRELDETVTIDGAARDSGSTPTTRLRGGLVLGRTSSGKYIQSTSGSVVAGVPAYADSAEAPDGDWTTETFTITLDGVVIVNAYPMTGNNLSTVIAELNALAAFAGILTAKAQTTLLRIQCDLPGNHHLLVVSSLESAFGASGTEGTGSEAKYRILKETVNVVNPLDGTDKDRSVSVTRVGELDETYLYLMSDDARRVLVAEGSKLA